MKRKFDIGTSLVYILTLLLTFPVFSQTQDTDIKLISGKITYLDAPISDVNIVVTGTTTGTKTNRDGEYKINARIGDEIKFSHVSFKDVLIVVEDVTDVLNLEMSAKVNQLDEAFVKARIRANSVSQIEKKMAVELTLPNGVKIIPSKTALDVRYLSGKDLTPAAGLTWSLNGKFAGLRMVGNTLMFRDKAVGFVVDGMSGAPMPDATLVEDIYFIKTLGLIYIRTIGSLDIQLEKQRDKLKELQNQNFYQDDAIQVRDNEVSSDISPQNSTTLSDPPIEVSGRISYLGEALPNANIIIEGSSKGTKTDANGEYNIKARVGDLIAYSYVGFRTVKVIVEDVTRVINIEMNDALNELEEVVVTAKLKNGKEMERALKKEEVFITARGTIDPKRIGYNMNYVEGDELRLGATNILQALVGLIPGAQIDPINETIILTGETSINNNPPPIWDIDGAISEDIPYWLDLSQIKNVRVIKTLAGTNRYGSIANGGVIVITTKTGSYDPTEAISNRMTDKLKNKNYYSEDALAVDIESITTSSEANKLKAFSNKFEAFAYYNQYFSDNLTDYPLHLEIAKVFAGHFLDKNLSSQVLNKITKVHDKNPEVLKAVAYYYQALGMKKKAIGLYQMVFQLRPKYAQSYRDLANAYIENEQFQKAWRLYMSYLFQGNDMTDEGIGDVIYNDMEWLYFSRRNQTQIKEQFVPKSENLFDFRNDIRMVFEWNTSEAEFELEFVNPERRAYVFDHSLAANQDLITESKQKGYSSKEFEIDEIGEGEWLVNITYKGNKKDEPTYFKLTTYYNWGKAKQTKEINVYQFNDSRNKLQLKRFDAETISAN